MQPSFTKSQQVFSLNQIANSAAMQVGTVAQLEAYATKKIDAVLRDPSAQALIGVWKRVWGPVVYEHPSQGSLPPVADNTMYVAQRTDVSSPEYVVGIAGTNPNSWYGWLVEDFTLSPMEVWPFKSFTTKPPKIARGTSIGIDILLNQMVYQGQSLQQFLTSVVAGASGTVDLSFTGHSLGGALSPTLALAFSDMQGTAGSWDPNRKAAISVVASAGPTPGDTVFSSYYASQLGATTTRYWNGIDVVPHAWQLNMIAEVPSLYVPNIEPNLAIEAIAAIAALNSSNAYLHNGSAMTQLLPGTQALPGSYHPSSSIGGLISEVEVKAVNDLIEKIGPHLKLSSEQVKLMERIVDRIIQHTGFRPLRALEQTGQNVVSTIFHDATGLFDRISADVKAVPLLDAIAKVGSEVETAAVDALPVLHGGNLLGLARGLVEFLLQAIYQHTTAYPMLVGTEAFAEIVDGISV